MGENKKVKMVLKVDLQCEKCYRKVKKVLCKFPQIRDQEYDEKKNQVIIKVVCCSPEKFRDKLYCKGRCVIKSIDIIIEPPTPPKPDPPKPPPTPVCPCPRPPVCPCPPMWPCQCQCQCPPMWPCQCQCPRLPVCPCPPVWPCPCPPPIIYCVTRPDCCSEENPQPCAIM